MLAWRAYSALPHTEKGIYSAGQCHLWQLSKIHRVILPSYLGGEERFHHLAALADVHFLLPICLGAAITDSAINEPTEFAGLKLPGRA